MRDLAKVVTVDKEWNLEGKDKVHGVSFAELAYEAMVSKDITIGDKVIFIQEGALLPCTSTWEFLRNLKCYNESENAFLIKVKKFKDIKSWGLCLKPSECGLDEKTIGKLNSGDDVTDLLNIRKYEPKEEASPKKENKSKFVKFLYSHKYTRWIMNIYNKHKKSDFIEFPSFLISKSDETTIQNSPSLLERYKDNYIYITTKLEGMSATYCFYDNKCKKFLACSRNNAYIKNNGSDYWKIAEQYDLKNKIYDYYKKTGKLLIIQGEIIGEGIQKNIYHVNGLKFYVYTMKDEITNMQLPFAETIKICNELQLLYVPVINIHDKIGQMKMMEIFPTIKKCEELTEKQYFKLYFDDVENEWKCNYNYMPKENENLWKDYAQNEGVVVRTMNYDKDKNIGCSFKIKNIDYAEKGINFIGSIKWKNS